MQKDYDDYEEYDSPRFRWMSVVVLLLAVAGFFSLAWYAYYSGTKHADYDDAVVIEADNAPVKVKPDAPGGAQFPHQEKTIYNAAEGSGKTPAQAQVVKSQEVPVVPAGMTQKAEPTKEKKAAAIIQKAVEETQLKAGEKLSSATPEKPSVEITREDTPQAQVLTPPPGVERVVEQTAKPAAQPAAAAKSVVTPQVPASPAAPVQAAPSQVVATAKTAPTAKPAPAPAMSGAANGKHLLQLGAFRSQLEAEKHWTQAHAANAELANRSYSIVQADMGAKGTYYRLRVGGFASADDANKTCASLKAHKQPCFYVKP